MKGFLKARNEVLLVFLIIVLALFFRLYKLDLTILGNDVTRDLEYANAIRETGSLYFGGFREGTGKLQETFGALEYYLLLIPMIFSKNPVIVTGFIGILNGIVVFICYSLCRRFFNKRIAVFASLLYAVNPWAVFYSRFVWNPNFIPFFTILFAYCLFKVRVEGKRWYLLGAGACLALVLNFHLITFFLFPLLIFILQKKNIPFIVLGAIVFFLVLSPYIVYSIQREESILGPITGFASKRQQGNPFLVNVRDAVGIPVMLATNYYGAYLLGAQRVSANPLLNVFFYGITGITVVFLLGSIVFGFFLYGKRRRVHDCILLVWLLIPIIGFIGLNKNISPHYGLLLYPAQFILIAVFADRMKRWRVILFSLLILIIIGNSLYLFSFYEILEKNGGTTAAYGIPYMFKESAARYIVEETKSQAPTLIFLKAVKKDFQYIFEEVLGTRPNYILLEDAEDLAFAQEGYLIVDKRSMYGYAEKQVTKEQWAKVKTWGNTRAFGGIEVIHVPD